MYLDEGSQQYQIGAGGALHALDPATGWNKWSVSFDFPPVFLHSPSTAGEYVGTSMKALTPWSPPPPQAVLSGECLLSTYSNKAYENYSYADSLFQRFCHIPRRKLNLIFLFKVYSMLTIFYTPMMDTFSK